MAEPTLKHLRAAKQFLHARLFFWKQDGGSDIGPLGEDLRAVVDHVLDAAIARAERRESGDYVKVRIPYVIDEHGGYAASAWTDSDGSMNEEDCVDATLSGFEPKGCESQGWITAPVPIPKPAEIEGEVSDG